DAEEDAVDTEQRAQVPVDGATAGVRELMQAALWFQKAQRLLQDPIALFGREAQQRQPADDEVEHLRTERRVELEGVGGNHVAAREAPLEQLHEVRVTLDEIQITRRYAACEQRGRDPSGPGAELDDSGAHADVPRHQPGQRLAARRERADRKRIANPALQEVAEIVGRLQLLKLGHAIAFLAKKAARALTANRS